MSIVEVHVDDLHTQAVASSNVIATDASEVISFLHGGLAELNLGLSPKSTILAPRDVLARCVRRRRLYYLRKSWRLSTWTSPTSPLGLGI